MRSRRFLCAGLVAVALGVSPSLFAQEETKPKEITTAELEKYLQDKKVFFLDVREPAEIQQLGSVPGYVNIPLNQLERRLKEVPKDKLVITL